MTCHPGKSAVSLSKMESEERAMNPNEAAAAIAQVDRTEARLAERARWPFHRHATFGLAEGLVVAGLAQPTAQAGAMIVMAMALLIVCVSQDRRRDGMFISGWQPGATRPLTMLVTLFVLTMAAASAMTRTGGGVEPLAYVLGAITFVGCTAASLRWESIYRADLARRARQ
jgi:hypothetical protein